MYAMRQDINNKTMDMDLRSIEFLLQDIFRHGKEGGVSFCVFHDFSHQDREDIFSSCVVEFDLFSIFSQDVIDCVFDIDHLNLREKPRHS